MLGSSAAGYWRWNFFCVFFFSHPFVSSRLRHPRPFRNLAAEQIYMKNRITLSQADIYCNSSRNNNNNTYYAEDDMIYIYIITNIWWSKGSISIIFYPWKCFNLQFYQWSAYKICMLTQHKSAAGKTWWTWHPSFLNCKVAVWFFSHLPQIRVRSSYGQGLWLVRRERELGGRRLCYSMWLTKSGHRACQMSSWVAATQEEQQPMRRWPAAKGGSEVEQRQLTFQTLLVTFAFKSDYPQI